VVDSGVTAADLWYIFGVDSRGNLNRPLEGLSRRGQKNWNQLALSFKECKFIFMMRFEALGKTERELYRATSNISVFR
jgi:hypothetical protein